MCMCHVRASDCSSIRQCRCRHHATEMCHGSFRRCGTHPHTTAKTDKVQHSRADDIGQYTEQASKQGNTRSSRRIDRCCNSRVVAGRERRRGLLLGVVGLTYLIAIIPCQCTHAMLHAVLGLALVGSTTNHDILLVLIASGHVECGGNRSRQYNSSGRRRTTGSVDDSTNKRATTTTTTTTTMKQQPVRV
jgi:hypothetical protein